MSVKMKKEGGLGGKRYKVSYPHPNTCETSICKWWVKILWNLLVASSVRQVKGKGKVTLFNVGNSFTYETAINGSRRCALYPPCLCQCSVLRVFKAMATWIRGKSKQTLKSLKIEPGTSRSESRVLANWANWATTLHHLRYFILQN